MGKVVLAAILFFILSIAVFLLWKNKEIVSPVQEKKVVEKPLDRYSFERLRQARFEAQPIMLGRVLSEGDNHISQVFSLDFDPAVSSNNHKKISGLLNVPKKAGKYPVIVMFRGFIPKEDYFIGNGTKRAGEVFAENGFITIAPDFLGYGESDLESPDSLEGRFQTYTTALSVLSSVRLLNEGFDASYSGNIRADTEKVGIWGHSNGGHIALAALAISGKPYPTVLWAPVTKPFPFSILYFTDEFEDEGKALRRVVANFEKDYDAFSYSAPRYYDWITAPIELHQGTSDEAVPQRWSDQFVKLMKGKGKEIDYFIYPGADHNLAPTGWSLAAQRSVGFFSENLRRK